MAALRFRDLIGTASRQAGMRPVAVGLTFIALMALQFSVDLTSLKPGFYGPVAMVGVIAETAIQYAAIQMILRAEGAMRGGGRARIVALLLLSIVTELGIALGLILLILPGLYLAARWLLAAPVLIAERATIGEAMGESMRRTEGVWLTLALALLLSGVPLAAGLALTMVAGTGAPAWPVLLVSDGLTALAKLVGYLLSTAAYAHLSDRREALDDIFA